MDFSLLASGIVGFVFGTFVTFIILILKYGKENMSYDLSIFNSEIASLHLKIDNIRDKIVSIMKS